MEVLPGLKRFWVGDDEGRVIVGGKGEGGEGGDGEGRRKVVEWPWTRAGGIEDWAYGKAPDHVEEEGEDNWVVLRS